MQNEEEMRRKGETVQEDAFDSNVITPGTEFMARLGKHLRFFIRRKIAEDPLWQKPTIVFSGAHGDSQPYDGTLAALGVTGTHWPR